MKRWVALCFVAMFLTACASQAKTAEEIGSGVSVEMEGNLGIQHISLVRYVNGEEAERENVVRADGEAFKQGEILWFDLPASGQFEVRYSREKGAADERATRTLTLPEDSSWSHIQLNNKLELELDKAE